MHPLVIIGFVAGGFVVAVLVVLGLRGRFGTPGQQGDYELYELERSSEVPSGARRARATCRGHDLQHRRQLLGAGVLWTDGDQLGFVLRRPRRRMAIPRADIDEVVATDIWQRPGHDTRVEGPRLLVVTWNDASGVARIAFELDDAPAWAAHLRET